MTSRMPETARTDPWEPQGSNPLGPPNPEPLRIGMRDILRFRNEACTQSCPPGDLERA